MKAKIVRYKHDTRICNYSSEILMNKESICGASQVTASRVIHDLPLIKYNLKQVFY